jgi:hypothetical protein
MADLFHILGVRHHGPGSARSVLRALERLRPDCVLLEGPPDAEGVLALAGHEQMMTPVALLVHAADEPARAVYYPFASFSPEWNAIRWAQGHGVKLRFMDLPVGCRMAKEKTVEEAIKARLEAGGQEESVAKAEGDQTSEEEPKQQSFRRDPLGELARAAGFDDGERWWEHVVEHRRHVEGDPDADLSLFAAIRDAMAALREKDAPDASREDDGLREAYMRSTMRQAQKEWFKTIAVVCGAFHAPALVDLDTTRKADEALLKGLPKLKTASTWVPWTHHLLCAASGYGAGVISPGWYEHLFDSQDLVLERWMTRVARLLREQDIDCSSAHIIESVRLAHTLAAMRARPIPDLSDIADAIRSVFCHDSDAPLALVRRKLLVGDHIGQVPDETPMVPLQQDLARLQKSLRMRPEALEKALDLDLRNETDLGRSHLLHRLRILGIDWGVPREQGRSKGTFKEAWQLRWDPHYAVRVIEVGRYGNTVADAAAAFVREQVAGAAELPQLAGLLDTVLLADLPGAVDALLTRIETVAAVASDVSALMDALPPLARAMRYGNVRQTDTQMVRHAVEGVLPRIMAGLPPAVSSLNDEAAAEFSRRVSNVHEAIGLLESREATAEWLDTLSLIQGSPTIHGLLRGKCARLLFDAGRLNPEGAANAMGLALSPGTDPAHAASWLEGFLQGSGLILLHDERLLGVIDAWVGQVPADRFDALVPLLRRTFSAFPKPERRQIGARLSAGREPQAASGHADEASIDPERAHRVLPVLKLILGAKP